MDQQGKHSEHNDALDDLLRRYMLETDPETEEGDSLLELAGERVLSSAPLVVPDADREAEMVARLKKRFPKPPEHMPGPVSGAPALRKGLIAFGSLAVLTTVFLLTFGLFADETNSFTQKLKELASPNTSTLADAKGMQPREEISAFAEGISSLQSRDGNPFLLQETDILEEGEEERGGQRPSYSRKTTPPRDHLMNPTESGPFPLTSSLKTTTMQPPVPLEEPAPDPFPLRGLYAQTEAPSQFFQLEDPKQDYLLDTRKGTIVHIPREAFVTASGESVRGAVQVEIKEVYDKSGYIQTNLPTVSNGRQLVSGGVVFVDASAAGRRLKLAQGKDIYLEFVDQKDVDTRDMELYHGEYNSKGEMNWVPVGGRINKMIPMPVDELYFDEFLCDCKAERTWNYILMTLTDKRYEDSWIATREFRQRLHALKEVGYFLPGLNYYRKHTNLPLWKADQKVAEMLQEDAAKGIGKETDADIFERFAQELHTEVAPFNDRGVDLGRWDARRQLLYRQVSREETEDLMRMYKLRRAFVQKLEDRFILEEYDGQKLVKSVRRGKKQNVGEASLKGFLSHRLGWINLDKVAEPTFAGQSTRDVKVRLAGETPLDARKQPFEPVTTFLVYDDINSVVQGSSVTGQLSTFRNIPSTAKAYVVAIGYENYVPYFGMAKLTRGAQVVRVEMSATTVDSYLNQLKRLN